MDEELPAGQVNQFGFAEGESFVDVTENNGDRRDLFELKFHPDGTQVARMEDVIDSIKQVGNLRIEVAVRVRQDPDLHGRLSGCGE
jgi:hypothetical protein